ncbi:MAG TPA: hypothetical protein PLL58_06010 [Candidatus Syntrophosphaera sp.]|nr:hypothetical protein [Candidatus Syntrophosphaera sp.]
MKNVTVTEEHLSIVRKAIFQLIDTGRIKHREAAAMCCTMNNAFRNNDLDAMNDVLDDIICFQTMPVAG